MNITEKVAYIKGLVEGLKLDKNTTEGKVLLAVVELLDDLSTTVSGLENDYDEIVEQLDEVDEDLSVLEEDFYDYDEDDNVFYEVTCPTCNETVCVSEPILLDGSIECPNCSEFLEFDLDGLSIDSSCGCFDDCNCESPCDCNNSCDCEDSCDCEPTCDCNH